MASDVRLPQAKLWPRNDLWFWGVLAAAATLETPRSVRVALTVLHMTNFIFNLAWHYDFRQWICTLGFWILM